MNDDLKKYCVEENTALIDGIKALDFSDAGFSIVVNKEQRVVGVITDGDIRRALLGGAALEDPLKPHIHTDFFSVAESATRTEILDLMQARSIRHVPVLDDEGHLQGLHLLSSIIGSKDLPNWAVIMAGGKGTRLRPITENLPKPMIKVAGRPILERLVLHLVGHGITRIFLSVNYMSHVIKDYFGDGSAFGCKIEYLQEDEPLGTGGALSLLPDTPQHPLLVMNGDLIIDTNLEKLLHFHTKGDYFSTMATKPYQHEVPYGCVEKSGNIIRSIKEKPISSFLVNAGIYVLSPEALSQVPHSFFPITQLFEDAVKANRNCGCFTLEDDWTDVGQMKDLKEAQGEEIP